MKNIDAPSGKCQIRESIDDSVGQQATIYAIKANCPEFPERVMEVSYTDTKENWEQTTGACSNLKTGTTINKDHTITKTFAVWADAGIDTLAFKRPNELPKLVPQTSMLAHKAYKRPKDARPATCAAAFSGSETCQGTNDPQYGYVMEDLR